MGKREGVLRRLRGLEQLRRQVQEIEAALQVLTPAERLVLDRLVLHPRRGNGQVLCELLGVEYSTVYRYKEKALKKLEEYFGEG